MLDLMRALLALLRLTPRNLTVLLAICSFLLLSPETLLRQLSVDAFVQQYRFWFRLLLQLSLGLLAISLVVGLADKVSAFQRRRNFRQRIIGELHRLSAEERHALRFYHDQGIKTGIRGLDVNVARRLAAKGIIHRAAGAAVRAPDDIRYNIGEVAWEHLNAFPQLLAGPGRGDRRP